MTELPTYVMHDGKRWHVEHLEEMDGEPFYYLTARNPRTGRTMEIWARPKECDTYYPPASRTLRGEREELVTLFVLRKPKKGKGKRPPARRFETTIGRLADLLDEAAAAERRAERKHRRRMRSIQ